MKTPLAHFADPPSGRAENGPFEYRPIKDECGRRRMTFGAFVRHIRTCPKASCQEVFANHIDLCGSLGIIDSGDR